MDLSNMRRAPSRFGVPPIRGDQVTSKAIAAYLDVPDHGLVLIEEDGRIAFCSSQARRLLGLAPCLDVVGRSLRGVVRDLGRTWRAERGLDSTRLGNAMRRGGEVGLGRTAAGEPVACTVCRMPGAGWTLRVEERMRDVVAATRPDPLTGLPDRAAFRARLDAQRGRGGAGFAVFTIALDRFKPVNDTLGHGLGDAVLRMAAERLQTTLRRTDGVARLGGDAFAVMQYDIAGARDAVPLARRIVDLLGRPYVVEGHLINIGASVGVALAEDGGVDCDTLLKHADLALDRAKRDGGARAQFFEAGMDARSLARRSLEIDLRKALALNQFELAYQPQLNLESDRLVGCEALIRWRHPVRGTVSPADFIPLAEEIGLIVPIGEWVLRTACREAARWPDGVTVAVNLSPAQFRSTELVGAVASALAASGLAPHRLELEITEGLLLQESDANIAVLNALRALGPRISMDDFGTGYASLSCLRSFPFDRLKIDRSFVSGGGAGRDSMAIVRAITSLGATFGMTTVAEGVETPEQMRSIRSEGCTDVQGYFIGRPMPAADIARLFADQAATAAPHPSPRSPEPYR